MSEKPRIQVEFNFNRKKNSKKTPKLLKETHSRYRGVFYTGVFFSCIFVAVEMFFLIMLKNVTDLAFEGNTDRIMTTLPMFILLIVILLLSYILVSKLELRYVRFCSGYFQKNYLKKLYNLSIAEVSFQDDSKLISDIANRMPSIRDDYFAVKFQLVLGIFQFICGTAFALMIEWRIVIFVAITLVLLAIFVAFIGKSITPRMEKINTLYDKYGQLMKDVLSGFNILMSSKSERISKKYLGNASSELLESKRNLELIPIKASLILQSVLLATVFAFIYSLITINNTDPQFGGRVIFVILVISVLLVPGIKILQSIPSLKIGVKNAQIVAEIIEKNHDANINKNGVDTIHVNHSGIKINNISFSYGDKKVLTDFSLDIKPNAKYLLKGGSGSGKSTLLKLMAGHLIPQTGEMYFGDVDYKTISENAFYKNIALLEQSIILFPGNIYDNICLGETVSEENFDMAVSISGLSNFIKERGINYEILANASNVSGGEKVRIALARCLVKQPRVLLLDEMFAHLDIETAIEIEKALLNLKEITVVSATHVHNGISETEYDSVINI